MNMFKITRESPSFDTQNVYTEYANLYDEIKLVSNIVSILKIEMPNVDFTRANENTLPTNLKHNDDMLIAFLLVKSNHKIDAIRSMRALRTLANCDLKNCKYITDIMQMFDTIEAFREYENSVNHA